MEVLAEIEPSEDPTDWGISLEDLARGSEITCKKHSVPRWVAVRPHGGTAFQAAQHAERQRMAHDREKAGQQAQTAGMCTANSSDTCRYMCASQPVPFDSCHIHCISFLHIENIRTSANLFRIRARKRERERERCSILFNASFLPYPEQPFEEKKETEGTANEECNAVNCEQRALSKFSSNFFSWKI